MSANAHTLEISLKLEGPEIESGNIRLDDFLSQIAALKAALSAVDHDVNGRQSLYYRVVNLSHSSPATIVIEPRLKPQLASAKQKNRFRRAPTNVHHSFFETLQRIERGRLSGIRASGRVIDSVAELVDGLGRDFVRGWIANDKYEVKLDEQFRESVREMLQPEYQSFGSVSGELLAINLARGSRFYVYPSSGPTSVACHFPRELLETARENIGRTVRVYGTKFFRTGTGLPFRVANVKQIHPLRCDGPLREFAPSATVPFDETADEMVRRIREEGEE